MKRYKNLIPTVILFSIGVFDVIETIISDRNELSHIIPLYFGLLLLFMNFIVYFKLRNFYKKTILATLALALLGLIRFTVNKYFIFIGTIRLDLVTLIIFILFFVLNFSSFFPSNIEEIETTLSREKIDKFKTVYRSKSICTLKEIVIDCRFCSEAKQAAHEVINERVC